MVDTVPRTSMGRLCCDRCANPQWRHVSARFAHRAGPCDLPESLPSGERRDVPGPSVVPGFAQVRHFPLPRQSLAEAESRAPHGARVD